MCVSMFHYLFSPASENRLTVWDWSRWRTCWWWGTSLTPCVCSPTCSPSTTTSRGSSDQNKPTPSSFKLLQPLPEKWSSLSPLLRLRRIAPSSDPDMLDFLLIITVDMYDCCCCCLQYYYCKMYTEFTTLLNFARTSYAVNRMWNCLVWNNEVLHV